MIKVYLAGPIRGLAYDIALGWREMMRTQLYPDITTYSPMRGKEALEGQECLDESNLITDDPTCTSKGIVGRDYNDVRTCDLLFVNLLGAQQYSIGTISEIAAAHVLNKPIILLMEAGNIHDHPFITEPPLYWVDGFDTAIELTKFVLLP